MAGLGPQVDNGDTVLPGVKPTPPAVQQTPTAVASATPTPAPTRPVPRSISLAPDDTPQTQPVAQQPAAPPSSFTPTPQEPPGSAIDRLLAGGDDSKRMLLRAGLGMMAAAGKPGATLFSSLGEGGLSALADDQATEDPKAKRADALADRQYKDRELTMRNREADARVAEAQNLARYRDAQIGQGNARLMIDAGRVGTATDRANKPLSQKEIVSAITNEATNMRLTEPDWMKKTSAEIEAEATRRVQARRQAAGQGGGQAGKTYPTAPTEAQEALRSNPANAHWFDQKYGPGAAARVLSQQGAQAPQASAEQPPVPGAVKDKSGKWMLKDQNNPGVFYYIVPGV